MIQIDMEMPENCEECRFLTDAGYCSAMPKEFCGYALEHGRQEWCPLHEDPDTNAGKWISVKDRLPNCNGLYLVWRPHFFGGEIGEPVVCYFDGQDTWHDSYGVDFERILNTDDVTHWMPLPEPPKEE